MGRRLHALVWFDEPVTLQTQGERGRPVDIIEAAWGPCRSTPTSPAIGHRGKRGQPP
jgi:hypothetical protein